LRHGAADRVYPFIGYDQVGIRSFSAAVPLTQMQPFGCAGSALTLVKRPSSTVATTPQREMHMAQ